MNFIDYTTQISNTVQEIARMLDLDLQMLVLILRVLCVSQ